MRFIFSILLVLFCLFCNAQNHQLQGVWTQSEVSKLNVDDTNGLLHFFTDQFEAYEYNGYQSKACSHEFQSDKNQIHIDANTISFKGKSCILPHTITDAVKYKNEMLILADGTLYKSPLPLNIVADTIKISGLSDSIRIEKLLTVSNYLLIQDSSQIHLWHKRNDEIVSFENRAGNINAAVIDEYGILFLASSKGLFKLNFNADKNLKEPLLKISEDNTSDFRTQLKLDSGEILIYNTYAFHPVLQEKVLVFSQLKHNDEIKEELIEDGTFVLKDLKPGRYTLRFYTRLDSESNSIFSEKISIEIKAPANFRIWMYLFGLSGLLLILSIYSIFKNSEYKSKLEAQRDKLILENKALKFEQQALQLQMNPHFIFNVLNSISGMVAVKDNEGARKYINEFSQLMRSVLNQSRSEYITLEDEIAYLKRYLSLERVTRNSSFEFEVTIPENADLQLLTLPMIIQPFVENSIVHGFKGKKEGSQLWVRFLPKGDVLEVTVKDNGIGRSKKKDTSKNHKSVGLQVVRERLGTNYNFQIIDHKNEHGIPNGTEVIIKLPLK